MSIRSVLSIVVLLCAQEAFTRSATLNLSLNLSARLSDENNHLTSEMVRICMKETQLSMGDLEKFKTNEIIDSEADESIQCFAHCIYEQMGIMKNGVFVDNMSMDTENLETSVCQSIRGNNKCDTAYKIHQCIQKLNYGVTDRDQPPHPISADGINNNDEDDATDSLNRQ